MIYTVTLNPAVDREYTVEAIAFDTVLRAGEVRVDAGGKGFNVARMLANLNTPSTALGFVAGRSGELLRDRLEARGIQTDFVVVAGETRTNVSVVTQAGGRYLKVNEPGPTIAPADLEGLLAQVGRLAREGDWWVLAGSLPPGVPEGIYADLTAAIQGRGGRVILDGSGEALRLGCRARPFLAKPNAFEAAQMTGRPAGEAANPAALLVEIEAAGVGHAVISLGAAGALCRDGGAISQVWPPPVVEKNPIGAGDAMVGGLVWALSRERPLLEAVRWGVACGAAAAALEGTAFGTRSQIEALLAQTRVEELAA